MTERERGRRQNCHREFSVGGISNEAIIESVSELCQGVAKNAVMFRMSIRGDKHKRFVAMIGKVAIANYFNIVLITEETK